MAYTQEFVDADRVEKAKISLAVESQNLWSSCAAITSIVKEVNSEASRRAKFDTMYGKIDGDYNKQNFDDWVETLEGLKTYLEENDFYIPEE